MRIDTLAIVGVGLIGGSVGLAAAATWRGRPHPGRGRPARALPLRAGRRGAVDETRPDLGSAAAEADVVLFCTPVDLIAGQVLASASACRPGTLLTDAGSTKAVLVREVEGRLPAGVDFVGGHPLAGSEKQGPEYSNAGMFEGRLVLLTRTPRTDDKALSRTAGFWEALGARSRHGPGRARPRPGGDESPAAPDGVGAGGDDAAGVAGPDGGRLPRRDAAWRPAGRSCGPASSCRTLRRCWRRWMGWRGGWPISAGRWRPATGRRCTALLQEGKTVRDGLACRVQSLPIFFPRYPQPHRLKPRIARLIKITYTLLEDRSRHP